MRTWLAPLSDVLPVSLAAMRRFPLRTALSILGVVIGVAAVVAMLSVSEGGRRAILRQVDRLGLQNLLVHQTTIRAAAGGGLRLRDVAALEALVPSVAHAAAVVEQSTRVAGPVGVTDAVIMGVTANYVGLRRVGVARGRPLTTLDQDDARVCLLGAALGQRLFGSQDPVGRLIAMGDQWLTVVGVLGRAEGAPSDLPFPSSDHDGALLLPLPALFGHDLAVPDQRVTHLWLEVAAGTDPMDVKPVVTRALEVLHNGHRDFEVVAPVELLTHRLEADRVFNVLAGSIAGLALLVGGIGIMNIMLASVLERTPEIGLRRTVGATRTWILSQFVIESVVMTSTGGVVGVLVGIAATAIVTMYAGWPAYIAISAVLTSLGAAVAVGLAFGIYPAIRAARLQPIDAVRYE